MRLSVCLLAIATLLIITGSLQSQEPVTSMDRAKRIMAIRAAAKRVIEDSKAFLDAPQTRATMREKMAVFMKADIPAHKSRDTSRKLCLGYARESIQDLLVSNVVLAVADASQHSPLPITVADVLVNVDSNWTGSADQVAGSFTERHFDRVFTEARKNITANQRFEAEKKIAYPPYPDLNKELSRLAGKRTQLTRADFDAAGKWWSNIEFQKIQPLFEEVQTALNATFKNIGNEIVVQYENQRALVRKAVANRNDVKRYLTSDGMHDRITAVCRGEIRPAAPVAPKSGSGLAVGVYELFAVTDADIRKSADKMEAEYFFDYVRALTTVPVSPRALNKAILSDLAAHKNARQSSELLNKKTARELSGWAASNYVRRPDINARVRNNATVKYFTSQLMKTGAVASAWAECVKQALATPLTAARAELARRQVDKYFSRLNSAKNIPDNVVNTLAEKRNFTRFKTMAELRESLPGLVPPKNDTNILLAETEALVINRANELNTAAEQAVHGQELCLRGLEKEMMPQLEQQVAARKPVAEISSAWADELLKRWTIQAQNTSSPYRLLLGRTSALLNKTVRQLYDAKLATAEKRSVPQDSSKQTAQVKQEEQAKTPQSASGDGAAAEAKTSRKTKGDANADFFLVIRDVKKNKCEALLETADGSVLVKTTFNPAQVEDAAEKIFSAFRDNIHDTMASKLTVRRGALFGLLPARRSGPKELGIYIVTQSALIRLKTSLLIRERIKNLINQWAQETSTTSPKLRWGTGFSSDGQKKPEK